MGRGREGKYAEEEHKAEVGRLPSNAPAQGERQLSRIGASQAQPEHGASDFGGVP